MEISGVMALVVQEALEVIFDLEISPAFTLGVKVRAVSSLTGAVITTLSLRRPNGLWLYRKNQNPVDSITISMSKSFQGNLAGSFLAEILCL